MRASALAMILTALSTPAFAGPAAGAGGVGVLIDATYAPRYGPRDADYRALGAFGCLGGTGHYATRQGLRLGASGAWCRGRQGVGMGYGDLFAGLRSLDEDYVFADVGLGLGGAHDRSEDVPYRSIFAHARLQAGYAITLWNTAVEAAAVVTVPVQVAQWVYTGTPRGFVTPTFGVRVALLWGRFGSLRPEPAPPWTPPPPAPPAAPEPPPSPAERPLAIPAG